MKKFREYLTEAEKTYKYRIKIVGDYSQDFLKKLESKFDQFEPVKIGDAKRSPIKPELPDFPKFKNESVSAIDVEFRYPAIDAQVKQLAQLLGFDPNRILMMTQPYDDGMQKEKKNVEAQNKDLLKDTDFPAPDAEQKELKKDYAGDPYDHAVLKNAYRSNFTVAGGKTKPAITTNDIKPGTKSPMTKINRPPRPATGSNPKG